MFKKCSKHSSEMLEGFFFLKPGANLPDFQNPVYQAQDGLVTR